jgi:hypothetical protein
MACQAKITVYWFSLMNRGEYCNQSSFYCNGSASPFWCAVNGLNNTCSRAPDGNFTCSCRAGFSGEHCELSGTACGDGYCYNGAACMGGGICDCPDDWQGSANCSISTPEDLHSSGHHGIKVHSHSEALFYMESFHLLLGTALIGILWSSFRARCLKSCSKDVVTAPPSFSCQLEWISEREGTDNYCCPLQWILA